MDTLFRNAYDDWQPEDLERFRKEWDGGTLLNALSITFGRTEKELKAKAKELGLKEYNRNSEV
jgi:hypothetical protein